jgi:hypothetical protein
MEMVFMIGMYYETYINKAPYRVATKIGLDWVETTPANRTSCYNMFRMSRPLLDRLHNLLVGSYELKSTRKITSVEALALFLWVVGAAQSVRQADDHFVRSMETVSRKFDHILACVIKLSKDTIRPKDSTFSTMHQRLQKSRFDHYFNNAIGAKDRIHIKVVVPANKMVQYMGRYGYTSQNVMGISDFDLRLTFIVAGWPESVHDMRVFSDARNKYGDKFPHPPPGTILILLVVCSTSFFNYILLTDNDLIFWEVLPVDSGYPNRLGYLSPYKVTK